MFTRSTQFNKKFVIILLLLVLSVTCFSACDANSPKPSGTTHVVVDSIGRSVEVPDNPQSICAVSAFGGHIVAMLGFADRMTSTCNNITRSTLLKTMCPGVNNAISVKNSGSLNAEAVLKRNTDIIFIDKDMYDDADQRAKLDVMKIPYVVLNFTDMQGQIEVVRVIGKALRAEEKAKKFAAYYNGVINDVKTGVQNIENRKVYRLYHAINEALRSDFKGSLGADWIAATGANNVAIGNSSALSDGKAVYNIETIIEWDPEIIICNEYGVPDEIRKDVGWSGISAVKNGKVFQIPVGATRYGHDNGFETPLAILWLANVLYPDTFNYNFEDKVREFYKEFFDFTVSDEIMQQIMTGNIRQPKAGGGKK